MEHVSETLEALADPKVAKATLKQMTCLRGVRGVPTGEIARIAHAVFEDAPPALPEDTEDLDKLFGAAFEDGLVAIGLLATCLHDDPRDALDLGLDWAERLDDVTTADALGWLVLGPAAALFGDGGRIRAQLQSHRRPAGRRCGLMAAMAWTPTTLEGPAAAPLRAKLGQNRLRMVDRPRADLLGPHLTAWLADEDPAVRKAFRRILRGWANGDPGQVVAWAEDTSIDLPKLLRDEVKRARRLQEQPDLDDDLP